MTELTITDVQNNISFTFDNSPDDGSLINQFEGFEYPTTITVVEDVANKGGALGINSKFGRRVVSFVAYFVCDVLDKRKEMLGALRQSQFLKLVEFTTVDTVPLDLQFEAYVTKVLAPYTSMSKPILVEMVAPDWRFYSQTEETTLIDPGDTETIDNVGNEITDPVFQITGPGNSITVTNLSTGESFTLDVTLIAGEVVVVNTTQRTVTLDGDNAFSIFNGSFFSLNPGENDIQFQVAGDNGDTELEITHRAAYNGI